MMKRFITAAVSACMLLASQAAFANGITLSLGVDKKNISLAENGNVVEMNNKEIDFSQFTDLTSTIRKPSSLSLSPRRKQNEIEISRKNRLKNRIIFSIFGIEILFFWY